MLTPKMSLLPTCVEAEVEEDKKRRGGGRREENTEITARKRRLLSFS